MMIGRVLGNATSTVKHSSFEGWKLSIVQPMMQDGITADGDPVVAIDPLGARRNDRVIISSDGKATRELLEDEQSPARWSLIGICDDQNPGELK